MSLNNLGLGFLFTAKDMASEVMEKVEGSVKDVGNASHEMKEKIETSFKSFATGAALMGVGLEIFEKVLEPAMEEAHAFSKAIDLVSTRVDEATFPQERMREVTMALSAQFGKLPADEAKAMFDAVAEGATDAAQSQGLLTAANEIALATQGDLGSSMAGVAELAKVYGVAFEDAATVADKLFVSGTHVAGGITGMEAILDKIAPTAKRAGVGMDQLLGYVDQLSAAGISGRPAMSGLKAVIDAMIAKGPNVLAQSIGKSNAELQKMFGSSEGATVAMALMRNQGGDLAAIMDQLAHSTGAAARAAATMIDPKEQFTALKSQVMIAIGEGLEPLEKASYRVKNAILETFLKIPKPVIAFLAKLTAGAASALMFVGAIIAVKAAVSLLGTGLGAVGVTLGGVLSVMLPIVAVIGLVIGSVYALKYAWDKNVGGFADTLTGLYDGLKLTFTAISELFSGGGFTADTWKQLEAHSGIKDFAIAVYVWVGRIENFFSGIGEGFGRAMTALAPTFKAFSGALERLRDAFAKLVGGPQSPEAAGEAFDHFGEVGASVGAGLADVFDDVVVVFTRVIDVAAGVMSGLDTMKPAFSVLSDAVGDLFGSIGELLVSLGLMDQQTAASGDGWVTFGKVVGDVVGVISFILGGLVEVISWLIKGISWVIDGLQAAVHAAGPFSDANKAQLMANDAASSSSSRVATSFVRGGNSDSSSAAGGSPMTMPAAGAPDGTSSSPMDLSELTSHLETISRNTSSQRPLTGVVILDGEVAGRLTSHANQNESTRGFSPSPVPTP